MSKSAILEEPNVPANPAKLRQRRVVKSHSPVQTEQSPRPGRRKTRFELKSNDDNETTEVTVDDLNSVQPKQSRKPRARIKEEVKKEDKPIVDKTKDEAIVQRLRDSEESEEDKLTKQWQTTKNKKELEPKDKLSLLEKSATVVKSEPIKAKVKELRRSLTPSDVNKEELHCGVEHKSTTAIVGDLHSTKTEPVKPLVKSEPNFQASEIKVKTEKKEEEEQQQPPKLPELKPKLEASSKPTKELLAKSTSSQSSSGVLDNRLSPLGVAGGRSLLLEPQEQERGRHSESPVILVERLNKAAPPAAHHQLPPVPRHHLPPHHPSNYAQPLAYGAYPTAVELTHHAVPAHPHPLSQALLEAQQQQHQRIAVGSSDDSVAEVDPNGASVPGLPARYGDSGSDSGVSSLRGTGSGDERSGSRSSAVSAEETTSSSTPNSVSTSTNNTSVTTTAAPARIWHVQSVQHTSLLMAHPQGPGAPPGLPPVPPVGYTGGGGPGPPPPHHHPALAQEMLWRPGTRFLPLPPGMPPQPIPGDVLDRHDRLLR